jgi:membrane-bound ClpP family serine protease
MREAVGRLLKDIARQKGNLLFLELRCQGGDLIAAAGLAEDLHKASEGDEPTLVVAYIPEKAADTAAVIALGCSAIVMSKKAGASGGTEAEFGDFEGVLRGPDGKQLAATWGPTLRELAELNGYPPLLAEGLVNKDLGIVLAEKRANRSVRRLMTEEELAAAKADWDRVSQVKAKGQLLKLTATQAEQLGLARYVVESNDPGEVYTKYGVDPGKVREATPAWLDRFANFLTNPAVTIILIVLGFTGLILELKVPGTTVPGIIAALCFILVFWAHTQFSGQVAVLAGLLFLLGLVLLLLEVFVLPGFGAAGVTGILVILLALGLATFGGGDGGLPQTTAEWTRLGGKMGQYLFAMVGAVGLAFVLARFLPNIPYANRLMLTPPAEKPDAGEPELPGAAEAAALLGAVGTAVTVLRPAGTVRFGDAFVDVVTDGGFVPAGARVQAIEVEGTRIVVKEV